MLKMLQAWKGAVEVNGHRFDNISLITSDMLSSGDVHIKLYPVDAKQQITTGKDVSEVAVQSGELKITVKPYMTRKGSPDFDFMTKWNNDVPMPLRTMQGTVQQETRGMVKMKLHGVGLQEIHCLRCGKELTHPVSRHYGIGPECMKKLGIVADIEDVDSIKEQLVNVEWEGWVIKSAITEQEEV